MSIESDNIRRIKGRWEIERRISGRDVEWLLDQAQKVETMRTADNLRSASQSPSERFVENLFGFGR